MFTLLDSLLADPILKSGRIESKILHPPQQCLYISPAAAAAERQSV